MPRLTILLLPLIYLAAVCALSAATQPSQDLMLIEQIDIDSLLRITDVFDGLKDDISPSFWIYNKNKTLFEKLTKNQKQVVYNELACAAREENHAKLKLINTSWEEWREQPADGKCNDTKTLFSDVDRCRCDNSSVPLYCAMLEARNETAVFVDETLPCADEIWAKVGDKFNRSEMMEADAMEVLGPILKLSLQSHTDFNKEIQLFQGIAPVLCSNFTIETHRLLSQAKQVDLQFRIRNDIMLREAMDYLPVTYCSEQSRLAKCLCDQRTVVAYCILDFVKEALDTYSDICEHSGALGSSLLTIIITALFLIVWN